MNFPDFSSRVFGLTLMPVRRFVIQELLAAGPPCCKSLVHGSDRAGQKQQQVLCQCDVVGQQAGDLIDSRNTDVAGAANSHRDQTQVWSGDGGGLIAGGVSIAELNTGLDGMGATSPADRIRVGCQRTLMAEVALGSDHVVGKQDGPNVNRISIDDRQVLEGFVTDSRCLDCRVPVEFVNAIAEPELVQESA